MQEATGQAGLMNIMLTIIGIIIVLLAGSIAYSKAFRVKNKIIDVIEKNSVFNNVAQSEIDSVLTDFGYRVIDRDKLKSYCPSNKFEGFDLVESTMQTHLYCVYRSKDNASKTYYYKVVSFMYFDIPVVGNFIEIPVTGETKVFFTESTEKWKIIK